MKKPLTTKVRGLFYKRLEQKKCKIIFFNIYSF